MNKDQVIFIINEYVYDEILPEYTFIHIQSKYFEKQSHIIWATNELIEYIRKRDGEIDNILKDFIDKMQIYSTFNNRTTRMFDIAYELAVNINDVLKAMD